MSTDNVPTPPPPPTDASRVELTAVRIPYCIAHAECIARRRERARREGRP